MGEPLRGADYYQHRAPFPLAQEVQLPDGATVRGGAARVYELLRITRERGVRHGVGRHLAPAGWVPSFLISEAWAGGQEGRRRLRDLRQRHGVCYQRQPYDPGGGESFTYLYRLEASGSSSPEPAPARAGTREPADLTTVRYLLHPGPPPAGAQVSAVVRLTPGSAHALAAPLWLVQGDLDDAEAGQRYRIHLRGCWRAGTFHRLAQHETILFWAEPEWRWALDTLGEALQAAGARPMDLPSEWA